MPDQPAGNTLKADSAADSVVLVSLDLGGGDGSAENLEELHRLAASDQLVVSAVVKGKRVRPDPATFAGSGKVDEIMLALEQTGASLVVFNHDLSPAQQRNLERKLGRRVVDRTSLILDIFAQRAKSHEGKLQVELAQLEHLATRLIRGWTHLERQKGGIGLRGPGETQLETDRRLIGKRVKLLKEKLAKFERQRTLQRRSRQRARVTTVSIVGYTNAGKSVGFIRDLPHTLVAAFQATLEETVQADLLLHVVDAGSPNRADQIDEVNKVLKEIGADGIPQILVLNKVDLIDFSAGRAGYRRDEYGRIEQIRLSAKTTEGLEFIKLALSEVIEALTLQAVDERLGTGVVLE